MLYQRVARGSVAEVAARVEEATKANKFGVMNMIDLRAKLVEKGADFAPACVILEVCNPLQAKRVLEEDMALATMLPCRIAVYEQGGEVRVATLRPSALIGLFSNAALAPVAAEVEEVLLRIIDTACDTACA
jgi:uncharacterized protein (DUF302 family)